MYWDWREEIIYVFALIGIIPFCLTDDLINSRRFFRWCAALSIPWFLLVYAFAYLNPLNLDPVYLVGVSAFPSIHLLSFEIFRQVFRKLTGKNPCITTVSSIRGKHATGGLFSRYPKGRRIKGTDFVFTILQAILPFIILFGAAMIFSPKRQITPASIRSESVAHPPMAWFAPINDPNKPDWEILPQEARDGEVILSKRNELGILSNFAATPFVFDGNRYASVEGFWQAMLFPEVCPDCPYDPRMTVKNPKWETWRLWRFKVARMAGFEAKEAGTLAEENMKALGIDWVTFDGKRFPYRSATPGEHYKLIVAAMRAKLEQNPEVKRILLATGDLKLRPDHIEEPNAPPEWKYYEIWMQIRSELQTAMQKPARQ